MANIEGHALSRYVCLWLFNVNLKLSGIFWIVYGGIPCHNLYCLAQSTCQLAKMRRNINRTWPRPFLWPRYALLALTVTWSGGVYLQEVWPVTHSLLHFVLSYSLPPPQRTYSNSDVNPQMGNICKCQTAWKWTFIVCYVIPCWARYNNEDNNLQTEWRQNLLSHGQWNHIHLWTRFQIAIFRTSIGTLGGLGKACCKNWTASSSFRSSVWWLSEE